MIKIPFSNLPNTTTPVNDDNLNDLQDNVEDAINIFDLYNDTSGADWQTMMKNKIDYCIANMDNTKNNTSAFINGGWQGINYGCGICSKTGSEYQLVWHSSDGVYYCKRVNNTYTYKRIENTITWGSGTVNSTYIGNVENNHWERIGNVVSYSFTLTTTSNMSYDTIFVTGLPRAVTYTRFTGINADSNVPMRFGINEYGELSNAYSAVIPNNQVIEGQITYITQD